MSTLSTKHEAAHEYAQLGYPVFPCVPNGKKPIETTMKYYVGVNAEATADELWSAAGTILGTTDRNEETEESQENRNTLENY